MIIKISRTLAISLLLTTSFLFAQTSSGAKPRPRIVVIGVNGMEMDVLRPLILQGRMPNLASVIKRGAYGSLRTVSAPNCPRITALSSPAPPPKNMASHGFIVGGVTANTNMLKEEPIWSILSKNQVTVGMANVPAILPGDAGERIHGQRYAHARQKLRGRRAPVLPSYRKWKEGQRCNIPRRSSRSCSRTSVTTMSTASGCPRPSNYRGMNRKSSTPG